MDKFLALLAASAFILAIVAMAPGWIEWWNYGKEENDDDEDDDDGTPPEALFVG